MNLKYQFTIETDNNEEYINGDVIRIKLNNGEILKGELEDADCLSLTIDRENNSICIDYEQIDSIIKIGGKVF